MNAEDLRALQAPLKDKYRNDADSAVVTLTARGELDEAKIVCKVETGRALVEAGLHPATGGDGGEACSGNMLLEALVACAGVTLKAVATALGITLRGGTVAAEGDLDFRGTLGVARDAPVGFRAVRLRFDLQTDASEEQVASLVKLTERYCVIYQTLRNPPPLSLDIDVHE
ncbi:OsmC family protein [Telmatospirillum siberiense]|uniref:Osmotically inducible protein OsmC n=1 Tax=Telmatospirillum siberiense TaxID=382514 RepID=A0A2N3Q1V7_9PROT|nr:OsmC family protein [Telmatospirillum siberiense]PKU26625.1 osmotically inducible protein OsmC [Telmatospirillum siberiense]